MEQRPIKYTFEDIRRYREGRMTKEEMHAFEKASLEDPFLSDALEGFMGADMNTSAVHLQNIKAKISGKEEETGKVAAMPQRSFKMWRVAAAFILTAGAALLIYKTMTSNIDETDVAKVQEKKDVPAQIQTTPADTTGSVAGLPAEKKTTTTKEEKFSVSTDKARDQREIASVKRNDDQIAKQEAAAAPVNTYNEVATLDKNSKENKQADIKKADNRNAEVSKTADNNIDNKDAYANRSNLTNVLSGRVAGLNNQPIQGATVEIGNERRQVMTDRNGNFKLNVEDTVVDARVSSIGYDVANVQLRANTNNSVQLQQNNASLEEVVVVGYGTQKRKSISGSVSKISEKVVDTTAVKPEGGWKAFNDYLAGKLKNVDSTGSTWIDKELEVEFGIGKKGEPRNVKVINSPDSTLNKPTVEAIKTGPKWTSKQPKKRTRVIIKL